MKQRTKRITQTKQTKQTSSGRKQDSRNCGARKNVAPTRKCREKARVRLLLHGYWFMYRFARGFGNRKKRNRDRSKRQRQSIVKKRKLGSAQAMLRPDPHLFQGLRCSSFALGRSRKNTRSSQQTEPSPGVLAERRGVSPFGSPRPDREVEPKKPWGPRKERQRLSIHGKSGYERKRHAGILRQSRRCNAKSQVSKQAATPGRSRSTKRFQCAPRCSTGCLLICASARIKSRWEEIVSAVTFIESLRASCDMAVAQAAMTPDRPGASLLARLNSCRVSSWDMGWMLLAATAPAVETLVHAALC